MAVQSYAEVPGMTQEMYAGMMQQLEPKLRAAPGFIAHVGAATDQGWSATEIWESEEAMNAWLTGTIAPMIEAAGMPMPPVQARPIHTLILAGK
jgi:hypothetical protein